MAIIIGGFSYKRFHAAGDVAESLGNETVYVIKQIGNMSREAISAVRPAAEAASNASVKVIEAVGSATADASTVMIKVVAGHGDVDWFSAVPSSLRHSGLGERG